MIIVFNFEYVTFIEKLKEKFEYINISLSNSQNLLILKDSYLNINHVDMNVDD